MKLTSLSHGAGCGCKLPAAALGAAAGRAAGVTDPNVLVGFDTADDAGVYRLPTTWRSCRRSTSSPRSSTTPTTSAGSPPPTRSRRLRDGRARRSAALNLVAFSLEELGGEVLREILRGGADVAAAAGAAVVGGHSIDDPEPKYGLAVTGVVHPDEVLTNAGGRAGDALVLTKPLGAGAVSTAVKRGLDAPLAEAVEVMTTLNRDAAQAAAPPARTR